MQKRLFSTYVIIIIFLSSVIGFFSVTIFNKYYIKEYTTHLVYEGKILSELIKEKYTFEKDFNINEFINLYSKQLNLRITIINKNGEVLEDSGISDAQISNHNNRYEVKEALNGRIGIAKRMSDTLKTQFIYVGIPFEHENIAVLRFSVPLNVIVNVRNQIIFSVSATAVTAAFLSFIFAYFFTDKIIKPINTLTEAVKEISQGNYNKKILITGNDQLGILTKSFNIMSEKLSSTIDMLENENTKLESIVNSMVNALIAIDNNGNIIMLNSVVCRLFKLNYADVIGKNFYDVIRNEDIYKLIYTAEEKKEHTTGEFIIKFAFEGDKILKAFVNPIIKSSTENTIGILIVLQDITQIRKLEQLRSDFVSNVTHELKTPLTSIIGFADTLKNGAINNKETALRFIDIINVEAKRLYSLILDILSLSEMETRKTDTNKIPENIKFIAENAINVVYPSAAEKNIKIFLKCSDDLLFLNCNKDRILQVFINLIDNAVKYTEKGFINIECSKSKNNIEIKIIDTGIGIPHECIDRIFERFYRVDKGRSRKAGGTGLGLSIVKHIIMLYNGEIHVKSEMDKGTEFIILIPYKS